jgi:fimbrial chaperone protein
MFNKLAWAALATELLFCTTGRAATLQVGPALIEVLAPGAASTLTLRNNGERPINVQVRVFRWSEANGQERLESTDDVIASPPAVTLAPKVDYVARVVRVAKRPVAGEEAYRLLVDELPDAEQSKGATIKILVRHSIPVFFAAPERRSSAVAWSVQRQGNQLVVSAHNSGEARLRVSALSVRDSGGRTVSFGSGLVGYVLGGSTIRWSGPIGQRGFAASGAATISGQGNEGPINATASVSARN